MKGELDEKIMKTFVGLRKKTYSNGNGNGNKIKKAIGTKKFVKKENLNSKIIKTV